MTTQRSRLFLTPIIAAVVIAPSALRAADPPKPAAAPAAPASKPGTPAAKPATPAAPAVPAAKASTEKKNPKDGAALVQVAAGELTVGADDGYDNEKPAHKVKVTRGFWIYKTEVTNAQYGKFLAANPAHPKPRYWKHPRFSAADQPVVGVSWDDAAAYCKWAGARLPTETEWELAARGTDARKFPWGKEDPDPNRAVFGLGEVTGKPGSVGKLDAGASPSGARDLAGNVWEWCADWYDRFAYQPKAPAVVPAAAGAAPPAAVVVSDPTGPTNGLERVVRGGSWFTGPSYLRASYRMRYSPETRAADLGFRAVISE